MTQLFELFLTQISLHKAPVLTSKSIRPLCLFIQCLFLLCHVGQTPTLDQHNGLLFTHLQPGCWTFSISHYFLFGNIADHFFLLENSFSPWLPQYQILFLVFFLSLALAQPPKNDGDLQGSGPGSVLFFPLSPWEISSLPIAFKINHMLMIILYLHSKSDLWVSDSYIYQAYSLVVYLFKFKILKLRLILKSSTNS